MFDADYRRGMEALGPTDAQMESLLTVLEKNREVPAKPVKSTVKTVLLAAALCVALAITALAVSPSLRETLLVALGAFAPYRQETEGLCVVDQGIELKVVSTLCDGNSVKVYLELRDLTDDRLDEFTQCDLDIMPANWSEEGDVRWDAIGGGGDLFGYDPASKTILASAELFGDGPPASRLTLNLYMTEIQPGGARDDTPKSPVIRGEWHLTVEAEMVEQTSIDMAQSQATFAGVEAKTLHLSVLGCTIESDPHGTPNGFLYPLTVYLFDGRTLPHIQAGPLSHTGNYTVTRWNFPEPVEPEDVVAIAIGQWYVPIESGTAQPGHWLPQQP